MNRVWLVLAVKGGFSILVVGLLVTALDAHRILAAFGHVGGAAVAAVVAATIAVSLLGSLRWWLLLRAAGYPDCYWATNRYRLIGQGLSAVLPGGVAGDFVQIIYVVHPPERPYSHALGTVLTDRLLGLGAVVATLAVVLMVAPAHGSTVAKTLDALGAWPWVLLAAAPLVLVAILVADRRLPRGSGLGRRIIALAGNAFRTAGSYGRRPVTLGLAAALSVVCHLLICIAVWVMSFDFGTPPFVDLLATVSFAVLAGLVPITINGLGVREALFALIVGAGATTPEAAVALSLTWYATSLVTMVALALAAGMLTDDLSPLAAVRQQFSRS